MSPRQWLVVGTALQAIWRLGSRVVITTTQKGNAKVSSLTADYDQ
jgi:hypothetical protein